MKKTLAILRSPVLSEMFQKASKRKLSEQEKKMGMRDGAEVLDLFQLGFKENEDTRKMVENLLDEEEVAAKNRVFREVQ